MSHFSLMMQSIVVVSSQDVSFLKKAFCGNVLMQDASCTSNDFQFCPSFPDLFELVTLRMIALFRYDLIHALDII